jgi:hypothetical protein
MVVERRVNAERRANTREDADRRKQQEFRLVIPGELRRGWLAVQSATVKVRLSPIPDGWTNLSDDELADLVARSSRSEQAASQSAGLHSIRNRSSIADVTQSDVTDSAG